MLHSDGNPPPGARRYLPAICPQAVAAAAPYPVGVLHGEGSAPEIVRATLDVLDAVSSVSGAAFDVVRGGAIGCDAERESGAALSEAVSDFCGCVFARGGAVLAGAGGGRFVYDLRRRFELFCKVNPIVPYAELDGARRLRPLAARRADLIVVRENVEGVYLSEWTERDGGAGGRALEQSSVHTERGVRRIVEVAARIAASRRGELAVVVKRGGLPPLAALWERCAREVTERLGVACVVADVDLVAYRLVQEPESFDVVVAPNLFGDVLSDLGGVVLGSRALTHGASFSEGGAAVYQTNHGSAHDLAQTDRANPAGQILALALLLRESFALEHEAALVERALRAVWEQRVRTADLAEPGTTVVGTRRFGEHVAQHVLAVGDAVASRRA